MRTIEYLIQLYPDKTGKELLEIQEQDKLEDKKDYDKRNNSKLELIKDFNKNGAYFKSTFGLLDQYRYDRFYNMTLTECGRILCCVESIVGFNDMFKIDRSVKELEEYDSYMPDEEDRITKEEFYSLVEYLDNIFPMFWGDK